MRFLSITQAMERHPPPLIPKLLKTNYLCEDKQSFVLLWRLPNNNMRRLLMDYMAKQLFRAIMSASGHTRTTIVSLGDDSPRFSVAFELNDWIYIDRKIDFYHHFEQTWAQYMSSLYPIISPPISVTSLTEIADQYLQRCQFLLQLCQNQSIELAAVALDLSNELALLFDIKELNFHYNKAYYTQLAHLEKMVSELNEGVLSNYFSNLFRQLQ